MRGTLVIRLRTQIRYYKRWDQAMKKSKNTRLLTSMACVLVVLAIAACGVLCAKVTRVSGSDAGLAGQQEAATPVGGVKDVTTPVAEGAPATEGQVLSTGAAQDGDGQTMGSTADLDARKVERHFTMPEDADYEPQEVLVSVPDGVTQEEFEQALASVSGARVGQSVGGGLLILELEGDASVEDAINQLLATGAVDDAQPNYIYYELDEKDSGVVGLTAALAAYDDQVFGTFLTAMDDPDTNGQQVTDDSDASSNVGGSNDDKSGEGMDNDALDGDVVQSGDGDGIQPEDDAAQLDDGNGVLLSDGNQLGDSDGTEEKATNDPLLPMQYYIDDMQVPQAWELAKGEKDASGVPVTVAVIDVGFDADQEDLADNVIARFNALDDSENVANAGRSLHGTHVAGVIAARANNELGIAGVSYNAQLALIRVADSDGKASSATLAHAYDWIIETKDDLNVRVANISLGAAWASSSYASQDKLLMSKIDEAYASGVVTVAAAGNASSNKGVVPYAVFPGDLSNVVSVINIDQEHNKAEGSNYNREGEFSKNISAPGTSVVSTYGSGYSVTYDGKRYNGYYTLTGTSTSAPCVSGILALEFAANPALATDEAIDVLYASARDLGDEGWDALYGHGEAMAFESVKAACGATIAGPRYLAVGDDDSVYTVKGSEGVVWNFASSDNEVVAIDATTGIAHPVSNGIATITVTGDNDVTLAKTVSVFAGVQGSDTVEYGETATYTIEKAMSDYQAWKWSSSDTSIAEIGADSGVLSPVAAGKVTVTATLVADPSLTFSKEVEILAVDIADASVDAIAARTYVGKEIVPALTISYNGSILQQGKHYTAEYANNVNVGTATVTITGVGPFNGVTTTSFTIKERSIKYSTVEPIEEQVYDGTEKTPAVVLSVSGRKLEPETDYTLSYENNVEEGTATVTITGVGNYTDTKTVTFEIVADPTGNREMYRLYNPNSGEHFYTASAKERDTVVAAGWNDEGVGWTAPNKSDVPVYRLYNANAGEHHYTMSISERDTLVEAGWNDEGIGWYSDSKKTVPLLREYNPNEYACNHNYTTNQEEHDYLVSLGWRDEGIAWYAVAGPAE